MNNEFLKTIYQAIDKKLGEDITVIDFSKQSPFYDYMIVVTARNERMANSIIDEIEDIARENNHDVISISKEKGSKWFLIDLNDIVCHIFYEGQREYYDLEGLWKDLGTIKM